MTTLGSERGDSLRCDAIGCRRGAKAYEISYPDGRIAVDLCDRHAKPLGELRKQVDVPLRPLRRPLPRGHSTSPVDPDTMPDDL